MTTPDVDLGRVQALIGSARVRVFFAARAARFRLAQPRPTDRPRLTSIGVNPVRVLITGAGLAAGYGVARHIDSMAGPLLHLIADHTGRGVTIDIKASGLMPAHRAIDHIGLVGSHTYDIVIFAPCYLEAAFAPGTGIPRQAAAIQDHLLSTGSAALRVIMLGVPRPAATTPLDIAAAAGATTANRALQKAADSSARVDYVRPADFTSVRDAQPFTPTYYAAVAEQVAGSVLPHIRRSSDGGGAS